MPELTTHRWLRALLTLAVVERRSRALPQTLRPARLSISGLAAYRQPVPAGLPRGVVPTDPTTERGIGAPVAADAVLIGKFGSRRHLRFRGFYADEGATVRVQGRHAVTGSQGIDRIVGAAPAVAAHSPGLMPRLLDHGSLPGGRTAYLVEETVHGREPRGRPEVLSVLGTVAERLHRVHSGVGVRHERLSALTSPHLADRWDRLAADGHVGPKDAREVRQLIARDALLEVSLGHGDLVSSNVLLTEGGLTLIDWEYAGPQPIAFDLAKLHINAGPAEPATARLDEALDGTVGRAADHYSLVEQLALAHVQLLSRYDARHARASAAGRVRELERQTQRRAQAVHQLLKLR